MDELWRGPRALPAHSPANEDNVGISTSPSQSKDVRNFPNLNLYAQTFNFFLIVTKTGWSFVFSFSIKCEVSAVFVKFVLLFS